MMMAQSFPAHAGMPPGQAIPHGHQMAGMQQHPGAAHIGGQPGPPMMQAMHPGVSGPQVTQGPMVTGMGHMPGTPAPGGPMQNAHALAHLGPSQQAMFQAQQHQQQMNFAANPQHMQQQQFLARQRHQAMLQAQQHAQQQQGMPVTMPHSGQGFSPAQMAQMKANMAGMNNMSIPMVQQMQMQAAQQAAANHQPMSQLQQQQHQQQQQHMLAAQAQREANMRAVHQQQQQRNAAAAQAQQMQQSRSQEQSSQPPQTQPTPAPQPMTQPPQQQTPQQPPQRPQSVQQQTPNNQQPQAQNQAMQQPGDAQTPAPAEVQLDQPSMSAMMMQQRAAAMEQANKAFAGQAVLQLLSFTNHLAFPARPTQLEYWENFVQAFFDSNGLVRQQLYNISSRSDKRFQIQYPSLARFYHTHFTSGVKHIYISITGAIQRPLAPNGGVNVFIEETNIIYEYDNNVRLTTTGSLSVNFSQDFKIEHLDIDTQGWVEHIPRSLLLQHQISEEVKSSPKLNNKNAKRQQQPQQASEKQGPTMISLPASRLNDWGITVEVQQLLEVAELMALMGPLMQYSQNHPALNPNTAMQQMIRENNNFIIQNSQMSQMQGQRNPNLPVGMVPNHFSSPAMSQLGLPMQGSPRVGGTPSPAHMMNMGGTQMVHQLSQQGSALSGSQGASANTSPNVTTKRRRPSAVKLEEENSNVEANGANKVKPSPRLGGKRQKGAAS